MRRQRQRDTSPELATRQVVHSLGLRFRTRNTDLPGSPDLANRSKKWAVFVHGCYWHYHEGCPQATLPKRNRDFWLRKLLENRRRDIRKVQELRRLGFSVITVWECQTNDTASLRLRLQRSLLTRLGS